MQVDDRDVVEANLSDQWSIRTFAKINLHLEVLGRRSDGFHEIETVMQSIDLHDDLVVEEAAEGELLLEVCPKGAAPNDDSNLVIRAARVLWSEAGRQPGAKLLLKKRIPSSAGLGGGSADAAAALVVLDKMWGLDVEQERIRVLAAELGSDVPFFLSGGLALATGRGERIQSLPDLASLGILLVKPDVAASTPAVYAKLDAGLTWSASNDTVPRISSGPENGLRWEDLHNDLETASICVCPEIGEVLEALRDVKSIRTAVTGSGSAVFALLGDSEQAKAAARQIDMKPSWWLHTGKTMMRDEAQPFVIMS